MYEGCEFHFCMTMLEHSKIRMYLLEVGTGIIVGTGAHQIGYPYFKKPLTGSACYNKDVQIFSLWMKIIANHWQGSSGSNNIEQKKRKINISQDNKDILNSQCSARETMLCTHMRKTTCGL